LATLPILAGRLSEVCQRMPHCPMGAKVKQLEKATVFVLSQE
jgi:hypothetical protein